jgi:hypothetical protein
VSYDYDLNQTIQHAAERLRAYARDAARPLEAHEDPDDVLAGISNKLNALASELEHALAARARAWNRRPVREGADRLWKERVK